MQQGDVVVLRRYELSVYFALRMKVWRQLRVERVVAAAKIVSEQSGRSMAQVALTWLRTRSVIPILEARKLTQLQDNLASIDLSLSAEQLHVLDDASSIDLGFPYSLYEKESSRAILYGGMRGLIMA
jgi:aryl-alcohol dehydrogenase-like predicted oxidoreductase